MSKQFSEGENRSFSDSAFDSLWGNERLKRVLCAAASSGTLGHAYIFEGAPGSGRHTAALLTALAAACPCDPFPCFECEACRKLRSGISPDFITISPEQDRKTIGVDPIRAIADTIYIMPNDLEVKFYLIPDADTMTPQAQNALLKLLEEPPAGVYFFILCENTANLLPTVKSRAPILKLQKFTDAELEELLLAHEKSAVKLKTVDPAAFLRCIRLADGSVGEAQRLLDQRKSSRTQAIYERAETFFELLASGGKVDFIAFTLSLADKRDELSELLALVCSGARDLLARKYGSSVPPAFFTDDGTALRLAGEFTADRLLRIAEQADEARNDLSLNANQNTALAALAARINN